MTVEPVPTDLPHPDYPGMGERLRDTRRAHGLSLRELARRLGVSPSLISQIERGTARPSVSTLFRLVAELDVSLDEVLFGVRGTPTTERGVGDPVQRGHDRQRIRLASGVIWERLTPTSEPGVEFLYVVYEVGGASSPADAYQRHAGHEWAYVISGILEVRIGFETHLLEAGDSISFDSTIPHRLANIGDTPAHAIWFVLGRASADTGLHTEGSDQA